MILALNKSFDKHVFSNHLWNVNIEILIWHVLSHLPWSDRLLPMFCYLYCTQQNKESIWQSWPHFSIARGWCRLKLHEFLLIVFISTFDYLKREKSKRIVLSFFPASITSQLKKRFVFTKIWWYLHSTW